MILATLAVAAALAAAPQPLAAKCGPTGGVHATPFWLTASDRTRLYAVEAGSGPIGVVLVHESPGNLCGWLPYMHTLASSDVRALALDLRGFGDSQLHNGTPAEAYDRDLRAAIARLHADGAKRVFLEGASFGGAVSLAYASQLDVGGVISLSGEAYLPRGTPNALAGVTKLHAPLLIVGARNDFYLPVSDALLLLRHAPAKDKRTAFYPGFWHGWNIVENAPYATRARALILSWLRKRG